MTNISFTLLLLPKHIIHMHRNWKGQVLAVLAVFIGVTGVFAQKGQASVKSIFWSENDPIFVDPDSRTGAFPSSEFGFLPLIVEGIQLPQGANDFNAEVNVVESDFISTSNFSAEELKYIAEDFKVFDSFRYGAEESYGTIKFLPFRRARGSSQVERVLSYSFSSSWAIGPRPSISGSRMVDNSVLAEGTWYKIAVPSDGVYRINRSFLQSMGIETDELSKDQINIYGNGGTQLPYDNSVPRPDDLLKNAIYISGNGNSFASNDYILFYAKGPDEWDRLQDAEPGSIEPDRFVHHKHYYSDSAYYFIRIDDVDPKRINLVSSLDDSPDKVVTTFQDRQFYENDQNNLAKSGREFFGEQFNDISSGFSYSFQVPNATNDPAYLKLRVAGRNTSGAASSFTVNVEGVSTELGIANTSVSATADLAKLSSDIITFNPADNSVGVSLNFNASNPGAQGWLDYLQLNLTRELIMPGSYLEFRDTTGVGPGVIAEYQIGNAATASFLWDITDPTNVFEIDVEPEASVLTFRQPADELREYVAFNIGAAEEPTFVSAIENQNLHAVENIDMVIIAQPGLQASATTLADFHAQEGMEVMIVSLQKIYNEFSSGNRDVTALKMFMKMLYDKAGGDPDIAPKHLLLFGDGSYNNKSFTGNAANYIITYESENSINPVSSIVSDDYFGFLDDNEGEAIEDKLDIGIGRLPVSTPTQANAVVNKILRYASENSGIDPAAHCGEGQSGVYGAWRNIISFVSDDQDGNVIDGNVHMRHSDEHADSIYTKYNDFDVTKIYMDAYTQSSTPGGERYPDAEQAIRRRVENGALIVNYIGHGGERGWAHERVLTLPTIQNWTNTDRLPLFMTATCELSRFDDPGVESAGELMILNPNGGAIALLTTTRIVYSASNQRLGRAFYMNVFSGDAGEPLTLGEITRRTKNDTIALNATTNMRNFSLLGDPALRLAQPKFNVYTETLNEDLIAQQDTIKALQEVTITGYVGDENGNKLTSFNGVIYPTVFDKKQEVVTQDNDNVNPYSYEVFENVIYKGKTSVVNGDFSFTFPVPRDISYAIGTGRVSYYAVESEGSRDAHGNSESFYIGGTLDGAELNTVGPEIELFMNDESFVHGGTTDQNPILVAKVFDENGINTVGNGIGHDITAVLDGNVESTIILNDYYEADLDTYKSGEVRYQLSTLTEGPHKLTFKAWDAHNNSSQSSVDFVVAQDEELALEHVLNYPNPFTTNTQFFFEHNQSCEYLDVRIQVFTVSGKLVKTMDRTMLNEGFRSEAIEWDGLDDFGDRIGRGVYVYKVEVSTPTGKKAEAFEKLVILR